MDMGDWLRSLGLGQYESAFREHEIEADVLPELTDRHLKDLGVSLGHRLRMLRAIRELAAGEPLTNPPAAQPEPEPRDTAERRQLTVMFCDLVGSTAISARLDPEDMRLVISVYQDVCSGVVARYDGFVANFMGDGILVYFGFPHAHEDDAVRAVHAGLEIAEVVAGLRTPAREKLAARIGIATGLVVVGDLVGQGSAQEQAVIGDTPNLAARLQDLAEPGGVVLAASTRRLLGDRFRLRDLGRRALKGLAEPVEAWAALGVSVSESRFEAAHSARLTGFVGREAESAHLRERQRLAWRGEGQIVLISGEAGIGKSRLAARLAETIADEPHTRLRLQCSPYHRDSALYPFARQLERAAGLAPQDDPSVKLDKLEALLGLATDRVREAAPLIASMLSIPLDDRYPALGLSPGQQRRQTLSALLDQMEGLARQEPVLMLFEDALWADATSLELVDLVIERMRQLPALLMITYRPEFTAPWKEAPNVTTIALRRLDDSEAETLAERVTGGRKLPAEVLAQIVAKTDGVPLFIEELTKSVLESGLLADAGDHYRLDGPLPPLAIPSTLQDSLMARLDRLATVKEIAQIGAAIGREFSYGLLDAVSGRDEAALRSALKQLEVSELVFRSGEPPASRYAFKHALVQDAAYESLLKSRRQILHRRIAETLRDKFADVAEAQPELVAHHFTQAGLTEPAIEYWGKAGDLTLRRSAFKEAIAHLGKAIEMTEALAGETVTRGGKLRLQIAYGNALIALRGFGAPETRAAFARAQESAAFNKNAPERLSPIYGLWVGSLLRGELAPMRAHAVAFLNEVEGEPDSPEAGVAHRIAGVTHWVEGDLDTARDHLERALGLFNPERDVDLAFRFGADSGVGTMGYLSLTLWLLGEVDRALDLIERLKSRFAAITHIGSAAYGIAHTAMFELMRGEFARATPLAARLVHLAGEHDLRFWGAFGVFLQGWAAWQAGEHAAGLAEMREGLALLSEQNAIFYDLLFKTALANAEAQAGDFNAALATLDATLATSERTGQRWFDAEAHRTRGEILLKQNAADAAPAEAAFLAALDIGRAQKARSLALRAALSLARLYAATNRDAAARAVLTPALQGFAPTAAFPELAEAEALLGRLKS
jgi:class 3 adenylate cyclase/predicted ATPase